MVGSHPERRDPPDRIGGLRSPHVGAVRPRTPSVPEHARLEERRPAAKLQRGVHHELAAAKGDQVGGGLSRNEGGPGAARQVRRSHRLHSLLGENGVERHRRGVRPRAPQYWAGRQRNSEQGDCLRRQRAALGKRQTKPGRHVFGDLGEGRSPPGRRSEGAVAWRGRHGLYLRHGRPHHLGDPVRILKRGPFLRVVKGERQLWRRAVHRGASEQIGY
mmetsp:Transcript_3302/g.8324  ORF Transcript_3302/g.8324 Transcript_3302/m.8324 type:complete len:217 (+) Transcript_3302:286-936(+)